MELKLTLWATIMVDARNLVVETLGVPQLNQVSPITVK